MELFNNVKHERLASIIENYVNDIIEDRGNNNVEDLASAFSNAGFTKSEFFKILDKYYLNDYRWTEEEVENKDANIEEVSVGDSDQAILETALTQIGIKYKFHDCVGYNWIEIETPYNNNIEINFNDKGEFLEICV